MAVGTGVNVSKANAYGVASPAKGASLSKANAYAAVAPPAGVAASRAVLYAVLAPPPPGVNVSKVNAYAVGVWSVVGSRRPIVFVVT
jgi:hypothetical protein